MQASFLHESSRLDDRNGDFGQNLSNDMHARNATNFGLRLHVDTVGDDLKSDALDVVWNHVVPSGHGSGGSAGFEEGLAGPWARAVDDAVIFAGSLNNLNDVGKDGGVHVNGFQGFLHSDDLLW